MFLVPPPPHANACIGHNFVTNTPIKLLFAIAIEVPDYKNLMIFGINWKNKMAQKARGVSNCVIYSPINFIFGKAIDNTNSGRTLLFLAQIGLPKWPPAAILKKISKRKKLCIDLKWREMRSKVIFGQTKWSPAAILWKQIKVAYWSDMARNAI